MTTLLRHSVNSTTLALAFVGSVLGQGSGTYPFAEVDTNFAPTTLVVPDDVLVDVLFGEGDLVLNAAEELAPAKGNQDFTGFLPIDGSSLHGHLYVNHEVRSGTAALGIGGDMTVLEIIRSDGTWSLIGDPLDIDFDDVGGTWVNCGGTVTPMGTILSAEEFPPLSNQEMFDAGFTDTSDVMLPSGDVLPRYQNMGYMVEVLPATGEVRKLYQMGRFSHEAAVVMPDMQTVYLTDDFSEAVLFRFVASVPGDLAAGQLFAYQQSADGLSGSWIALPMDLASLVRSRNAAIERGATLFQRLEWIAEANGLLYISETGRDSFNWDDPISRGGVPAKHHMDLNNTGANNFVDPHGRVLVLNPSTDAVEVLLEAGLAMSDDAKHLSNPDGLATVVVQDRDYLVIHEDITGVRFGRVPPHAEAAGRTVNEVYWLDLSVDNPTVDDLYRFAVGPTSSETTGPSFTPDGANMFMSVQHPSSGNQPPFDRSITVAIRGLQRGLGTQDDRKTQRYTIGHPFPHPATDRVHMEFSLATPAEAAVRVLDLLGRTVATIEPAFYEEGVHIATIDVAHLPGGLYLAAVSTKSEWRSRSFIVRR